MFLFIAFILVVFSYSGVACAQEAVPIINLPDPLDILGKSGLFNNINMMPKDISTAIPSLPKIGGVGDGANLDTLVQRFINLENLSSDDISGVLKAVVALAINLFLVIIETVAGVLRALLLFL